MLRKFYTQKLLKVLKGEENPEKVKAEVTKYLQRGANVNAKDERGATILHWAILNASLETIQLLLESGANVNAKDNNGATILHWATLNASLENIQHLLKSGAEINAKNKDGQTALFLAINQRYNFPEIVRLFLLAGADVTAKDNNGETALHKASQCGDPEFIQLLLQFGANANAKNNEGRTPLHFASLNASLETIQLFLKFGANVNSKDRFGNDPLAIAENPKLIEHFRYITAQNPNVIKLLQHEKNKNNSIAEIRKCIGEIRRNAKILSLLQGPKDEDSPIAMLPLEILVKIASETNDKVFDSPTRYTIAYSFFKQPTQTIENDIEAEEIVSVIGQKHPSS